MRRWYDDVAAEVYPDDTITDYRRAIRGDDHPEYAAMVKLGRPALGIDLFIGEPELIGMGHGPALIRAFLRDVAFPRYRVELFVIGPARSNAAAIRAYEKAGFRFLKTYLEPDSREPEHYLMELTRAELDAGEL